jgi:hypothetical protein
MADATDAHADEHEDDVVVCVTVSRLVITTKAPVEIVESIVRDELERRRASARIQAFVPILTEINGPAGFETHIKPMFRERDRQAWRPASTSGPTTTSANTPTPSSHASETALCRAMAPGPRHRSTSSNAGSRAESRNEQCRPRLEAWPITSSFVRRRPTSRG